MIRISLGNKVIGIVAYISVVALSLCFIITYFYFYRWELLCIASLLIFIYSLHASIIYYIRMDDRCFFLDNIFKSVVKKDALLFKRAVVVIPFTYLMRIDFKDNTSYFFWGESEEKLNDLIKKNSNIN